MYMTRDVCSCNLCTYVHQRQIETGGQLRNYIRTTVPSFSLMQSVSKSNRFKWLLMEVNFKTHDFSIRVFVHHRSIALVLAQENMNVNTHCN